MLTTNLPDLASALRLQSQSQTVRADIDRTARELTTGVSADVRALTQGDLAPVFGIDRELSGIDLALQDLGLAEARSAAAQTALEVVADRGGTLGTEIIGAAGRGDPVSRDSLVATGEAVLRTMVSSLNTEFGGASLFSGTALDTGALASADQLLSDIQALLAGATTPADAQNAIDLYFDTPGGAFETTIYTGSNADAAGVAIDDDNRLSYLPRADDPALREALKSIVMVAAAGSASFSNDPEAYNSYLVDAGTRLQESAEAVTGVRAALGQAQEQIAEAIDTREAERTTLASARNDLIGVDQFDAAAKLAELESQLEALYLITGRISNLSLTNYLR
ncbi:MAG: flagellin [Pseudomonadota bacterium]